MSDTGVFRPSWAGATSRFWATWKPLAAASFVFFVLGLPAQAPNIMGLISPMPQMEPGVEPTAEQTQALMAALPMSCGLGCCAFIYQIFVLYPICSGLLLMSIAAVRGDAVRITMVFSGFERYWTNVAIWVLWGLCITVPVVVMSIPLYAAVVYSTISQGQTPSASPGFVLNGAAIAGIAILVLGAIPIWWLVARTVFCVYRVVDPNRPAMGPVDAIRWSFGATRGKAWGIIGTYLAASICMMASALLCGAGILFVGVPFAMLLLAGAYQVIAAGADEADGTSGGGFMPPEGNGFIPPHGKEWAQMTSTR